ncbi:MAG: hypothetical protein ACREQQ_17015 [Candidatus Binatia bacterium]
MNMYRAALFLLFFTFAFIAMDEYIAKPVRRKRMKERAKTDPLVKRALEVAEEVERREAAKQH